MAASGAGSSPTGVPSGDPDAYRTLAGPTRREIDKVKGSRFLASAFPIAGEEEAARRLAALRAEHRDARHTCWAWRLGERGERFRWSDDGEPAGSAGRPILQQIEAHELDHALVAVTRWFGGVKLGVGGLVRAYGGAAAAVLARAAVRSVPITRRVVVEHPWDCAGAVQALVAVHGLTPVAADYGARVRLELALPRSSAEAFLRELADRTSGRARGRLEPPS